MAGRPDTTNKGSASRTLVGRAVECREMDQLLRDVRDGRSRALVITGEPGIGKTALVQYALSSAEGFEVARAAGVESEMELPFAGLHQLCMPMLDRLARLSEPQREAISTALGLAAGRAPDRFLLGLAVLSLLSESAEWAPLLCVVDDAQWLDRSSAHSLGFAARRLMVDRVGMIFVVREPTAELDGLPQMNIDSLPDSDARTLLGSALRAPLDDAVRDRIVAETHGNPLALLEWPKGLTTGALAGGFGLPGPLSVGGQIEENFRRRLAELPEPTRRLLTVAAAEPTGDPVLVWRAAARLGIEGSVAAAAVDADLVELGTGVWFRHPSVRSAAYRMASAEERRHAHAALGEVTDAAVDPDRRAWHRALATSGPDKEVAAELEASAGRAQSRGGLAAGAALLERSAMLSVDPARRAGRTLAAAAAHLEAGSFEASGALLAAAERGYLDDHGRAQLEILQGLHASAWGDHRQAPGLELAAARRLESVDPSLARAAYVGAMAVAVTVGQLGRDGELEEIAKAALSAPPIDGAPAPHELLCQGHAMAIVEGPAAADPVLRDALAAFRVASFPPEERVRWYGHPCGAAIIAWDFDSYRWLATKAVESAREAGGLTFLSVALNILAMSYVWAGDLATASSLVGEAQAIVDATGSRYAMYAPAPLACMRGPEAEALVMVEDALEAAHAAFQGSVVRVIESGVAKLSNALRKYDDAFEHARRSCEGPLEFSLYQMLPELIEAATRTARRAVALGAMERLAASTTASGTEWALGIEARCLALLNTGFTAESLYCEAIERLGHTPLRPETARAHLLYGEWLRRENRRVDARDQLRVALEEFGGMGMAAFAERARAELAATGESVRKRSVETRVELTPQEVQIARLAGSGHTNPEIGAQLFISSRTVEWHLRKVFTKLNISSRRQLRDVLPHIAPASVTSAA